MLFNCYLFIFGFLPATLIGYFGLGRLAPRAATGFLAAASLFFYGWWNPAYLWLLCLSIAFNYAIGLAISRSDGARRARLLFLGIAGDLLVLFYFKYFNFLLGTLAGILALPAPACEIVLPIGISFFTFTQIAFLVDTARGEVGAYDFLRYALFVTFFPHLLAGPLYHHKEIMPQFAEGGAVIKRAENLSVGLTIFIIGLFKKVVLADGVAFYATPVFAAAASGGTPDLIESWGAALAYGFQLYYDFSGYSDMAIGAARCFGIVLPLNFHSPYKAVNIIEFWRRWHMTLSRFLRDYLYIPLGGNRHGPVRRHVNLLLTMLLGGLWHGAAWTFVFWGGLHGVYLVVNHAWHWLRRMMGRPAGNPSWGGLWLGRGVTLLAVIVGWVFFRADSFAAAAEMLRGMAGRNGAVLPSQLIDVVPLLGRLASGLPSVPFSGNGTVLGFVEMVILLAFGLAITLLAPNLYDISARTRVALLIPSFAFTLQKVVFSAGASQFLYFRF